jgi:2-polyprenyl-3-methyl-5-hydroxy-6-metoxy-1,4-benzoquinol methylase
MRLLNHLSQRGSDEGSQATARAIVPVLNEWFKPKTVADVGCGGGAFAVEFAKHAHVDGFDSVFPGDSINSCLSYYCCDLRNGIPTKSTYDIALCLEVGEHMPESCAAPLVSELVRIAPIVVFSAAIPLQGGPGHVNEQWQSWWAALFLKHSFFPSDKLRRFIWANASIPAWYRQNTIIYARITKLEEWDATPPSQLNVVHPEMWSKIGVMGVMKRLVAR